MDQVDVQLPLLVGSAEGGKDSISAHPQESSMAAVLSLSRSGLPRRNCRGYAFCGPVE